MTIYKFNYIKNEFISLVNEISKTKVETCTKMEKVAPISFSLNYLKRIIKMIRKK